MNNESCKQRLEPIRIYESAIENIINCISDLIC